MPCAIDQVSGINRSVRKAGSAVSKWWNPGLRSAAWIRRRSRRAWPRCVPSSTPPTVVSSSSSRPRSPPVAGRGPASSPASSGWRGTRGAHHTGPVRVVAVARRQAELPETVAALVQASSRSTRLRWSPPTLRRSMSARLFVRPVGDGLPLRRTLAAPHFGVDPAEEQGRELNSLTQGFDGDGRYRLRVVLDADEGRSFARPCRRRMTLCFAPATAGSPGRTHWWRSRRSLATVTPLARRDAFLAIFHVPIGSSPGHLHGGPALPDQLRRQLLCDGRGTVVGVRHGRPVSLGRSTRIVPTRMRQLIEDRDRGCRVPGARRPGCRSTTSATGRTAACYRAANLVALCHRHHRLHHGGGLQIDGDPERPDGLVFVDRFGRSVGYRPVVERQADGVAGRAAAGVGRTHDESRLRAHRPGHRHLAPSDR